MDKKDWTIDGEPVAFKDLPVCCQENLVYGRPPCCADDRVVDAGDPSEWEAEPLNVEQRAAEMASKIQPRIGEPPLGHGIVSTRVTQERTVSKGPATLADLSDVGPIVPALPGPDQCSHCGPLRQVLWFYASPETWEPRMNELLQPLPALIEDDRGMQARAALGLRGKAVKESITLHTLREHAGARRQFIDRLIFWKRVSAAVAVMGGFVLFGLLARACFKAVF